jgi:hypothetical protein
MNDIARLKTQMYKFPKRGTLCLSAPIVDPAVEERKRRFGSRVRPKRCIEKLKRVARMRVDNLK